MEEYYDSLVSPLQLQQTNATKASATQSHSWAHTDDIILCLQSCSARPEIYFLSALQILQFRCTGSDKISIPILLSGRFNVNGVADVVIQDDSVSVGHVLDVTKQRLQEYSTTDQSASDITLSDGPSFHFSDSEDHEGTFVRQSLKGMTWNFIGFASCRIDYNPSHNQQLEIETLIVTFTDILSAVLKNPGIALAAIEFPHALDQLRRCQYPVDPPMEQPLPGNLIEAFQHSLLHHKKRIALIEGSLQLTYSELDDTSSFFAHGILTQLGQDPPKDRFIALCIPQSALALIAILGILKTGNAYAPIDIRQAPERVFEMLKCAGFPPLLISKDSPDFLRHGEFKQWTIDITGYLEEWRDSTSSATLELIEPVPCSKLACLLFTSGTTGKPKGVRVSHQNILTLALNDDAVLVREDDRVAQINNLAWDTVHLETWCPLLRGAAIVCFDRYVILDPLAVKDNFKAFGITATFFSAALLRFFVSNEPKLFESLRLLHTGGETGRFEHFIKARKANPELVIQNSYGPMECCVYSTTRIMGPSTNLPETGNVPIGSPLKTAQVLLLDCQGRLVPPGIIGEIWISGRHVADGYEGREEDTKDSFVQIQVSGLQKSPRTYYRSGDRGRLNAACEIEFCGRINFEQIKVRGQRMELSDVEASIARVLMMEDVAVSYHQTEGQLNSALIGYVVPSTESNMQKDLNSEDVAKVGRDWEKFFGVIQNMSNARQEFIGWNSAINKEPFPVAVMKDFLKDTLRPFLKARPTNVLEVGCGNGIIACHLASEADHFYGMELAQAGVKLIEEQLSHAGCASNSTIWAGAADELSKLPDFNVDFVMINSVIQYFPSLCYLESVLQECVRRCASGGQIVIGDIRSAPLDDLMAVDIVKHQWGTSWPKRSVKDLRDAARSYQQLDKELTVDPSFFFDLESRFAEITHVQILPKHFPHVNELSQYRYQAILHVTQQPTCVRPAIWRAPSLDDPHLAGLQELLSAFINNHDEQILAVEKIKFSFVTWQREILKAATSEMIDTEALLGSLAPPMMKLEGWSAADLEELARQYSLHVQISFARQDEGGFLDAVFTKDSLNDAIISFPRPNPSTSRWRTMEVDISTYKRTKIRGQAWDNIVEALRHSLPAYMIPDALYIVDFVPLTTNSKIDRAKLKKIAGVDFNTVEATDVVPVVHRNEIEYKLCSIFQALLGSKAAISPTIDFFARGGHSLLAMKLRYAVQDAFKVNVALADIFETPTPEGLARKISRLNPIELIKQAPTYVKRAGTAIAELSFPQLRMWFMHQLNPESVLYNSGFCYHFQAAVNEGVLERTITELVSRHDCMRMTFLEEDGVPKSEITGIYPTLEKVNIDGKTEDDLKTLIREHCYRPYNLHSEPPIRPVLFMKKGESFLLVGMHHIITDGSSVELWTREMEMIYPALLHGKQLPLESLPWTYQDFAVWQRSDDFEHLLKPQIEYWKAQLNGSEPCRFPADYTNESLGPALSNGKRMIVTLEKALKDKIHLVCRRFGVTWFMLLSAMVRAVQFQWTAQQDGSFCFPNANRRRAEISEVSGLFVNTQVLRLKCQENMLFSELLQQSRRVSLEAFTNEDVPFDRLVKELNPTRTLNQNPLSEIMFAYQNFDFWSFDMGNIPAEMYPYWAESTRFDLEIQWFDYGDTLQCELNYRDSVFKKTTIQEISNKMMKLLQAVADDQDPILKVDRTFADNEMGSQNHVTQEKRKYWETSLEDHVNVNIPADIARPLNLSSPDRILTLRLSANFLSMAHDRAKQLNVPFESVLVSAYALTLGIYSNQEDVTFGVDVHTAQAEERLVPGTFGALPLRFSLIKTFTCSKFVQEIDRQIQQAVVHHLPVDEILETLHIERTTNRHPIYQHAFISSGASSLASANLDLVASISGSANGSEKVDFFWSSALFTEDTVSAIAATFEHILKQLTPAEAADKQLASLRLASQHIIVTSSEKGLYRDESSLANIFVDVAQRYRTLDAVVCGDDRLTYADMQLISSQLAHYLQSKGVTHGGSVGILFPPCVDMIVCVIALWKLGAAYVPLSSEWPLPRLIHVLKDASVSVLLSQRQLTDELATSNPDLAILHLDDHATKAEITKQDPHFIVPRIHINTPAYYIYTSGTTGVPKGVVVSQKSVINFANDIRHRYLASPPKRQESIPLVSPLVFDFSIEQMALSILSGNKLVLLPMGLVADDDFYEYLKREEITYLSGSTSVISQLDLAKFADLRRVTIGGEKCTSAHLKRIRNGFQGRLTNIYGTTETTVYNMAYEIYGSEFSHSIGTPIAGHNLYISNEFFQELPRGAVGELFISGSGVASGYLNRPDLTKQRFLPNPFLNVEGHDTVYRTGDLVRCLSNDTIEYIGRNDKQVQVHGTRIELGEIEQILVTYPGIVESVVLVRSQNQARSSSKVEYLVGYYTCTKNLPHDRIKAYLAARLPPTYILQFLVQVPNKLPTTISGKLNITLLPDIRIQETTRLERKPRNDFEADLCRIWTTALDTEIFIDDDFFRIGGDSIIAIRLVHELNKYLHAHIQVRDIFLYPTVAKLAAHMTDAQTKVLPGTTSELNHSVAPKHADINRNKDGDGSSRFVPYICIFEPPRSGPVLHIFPPGAGGAESYYRNLVPALANIPIVAYNNILLHDPNEDATYEDLARQYIVWLKNTQQKGPYHLFGWSFGGVLAFEISVQLTRAGDKVSSLTLLDPYFNARRIAKEARVQVSEVLAPIHVNYAPTEVDMDALKGAIGRVVLFKSPLANNLARDEASKKFFERYRLAKFNGLDAFLAEEKIDVTIMEGAGHYDWVKKGEVVEMVAGVVRGCLAVE